MSGKVALHLGDQAITHEADPSQNIMILTARQRPERSSLPMWLLAALLAVAAAATFIDSIAWVVKTYSPLPFQDQWDTLLEYDRWVRGEWDWLFLFAQHNEHRIALPRLFFLIDFELFDGSNAFNVTVTNLLQLVHIVTICSLAHAWRSGALRLAIFSAVAALFFFIGQFENLFWGFQVQFVGVYLLATLAFAAAAKFITQAREEKPYSAWLFATLALLAMATYTMANGLVVGFVLIAYAFWVRAPAKATLLIGFTTALLTLTYFWGYEPIARHTSPGYVLAHPVDYVVYIFAFLGNLAAVWGMRSSVLLGALGAFGVLAALVAAGMRRDSDPRRSALLAVMLFIGASAAVTGLGRLSLGVGQALSNRYVTPGGIFWAAQLLYWCSWQAELPRARRRYAIIAAATLLVAVTSASQLAYRPQLEARISLMRSAEDALLSRIDVPDVFANLYPDPAIVAERSSILIRHRLSVFAEARATYLGRPLDGRSSSSPALDCAAVIQDLRRIPGAPADALRIRGAYSGSASAGERLLLTDADHVVRGYASLTDFVGTAANGAERQPWQGFTRARDGTTIHMFALQQNGEPCHMASVSPVRVAPVQLLPSVRPSALGAPLTVAVRSGPVWTGGEYQIPGVPPGPAYTSWARFRSQTGEISFGPFTSQAAIGVAVLTGPRPANLRLALVDAGSGRSIGTFDLPAYTSWSIVRIPVPSGVAIILKGMDDGAAPDEWLAISPPHELHR